ncbi:MAG: hypothetical protein WBW74_07705, partial [Xanthobacteraceae bacterium]
MTIGTLAPGEKDLYKIVAVVRQLTEGRSNAPAISGDATLNAGTGVLTIASDAVTNAKLADMAQATVKGRAAGAGTGDPADLSVAQLVALIGIPANIRVFKSSTTYPAVTNGNVKVLVRAKGGGGGGGGGTTLSGFGGGGGEGAISYKLTTASALGGQAVTIGAGGANVAANTDANGGAGGTSSIGTVITAPGGIGGTRAGVGGQG